MSAKKISARRLKKQNQYNDMIERMRGLKLEGKDSHAINVLLKYEEEENERLKRDNHRRKTSKRPGA